MGKLDRLPTLNGFRGIAILLVMWFHLPGEVQPGWLNSLRKVSQPGYFGVDLFFVLSGFLITRILLYDRESQTPLSRFWIRRFLRIFPIYYALLLVMVIIHPSFEQLWAALYVTNFVDVFHGAPGPLNHTWSLAVEEQFYLVWPLLVYYTTRKQGHWIIAGVVLPGAILFSVLMPLVFDLNMASNAVVRLTPARMLSLGLGGLFAYHEGTLRGNRKTMLVLASFGLLLGGASLVLKPWLDGSTWVVVRLVGGTMVSGGLFLMVLSLRPQSSLGLALSRGPLPAIGIISYGLYLYHQPIYWAFDLHQGHPATVGQACAGIAVVFLVATVSYFVLEKPVNVYKEWITGRQK